MTPNARIAAAIDIIDAIFDGLPAEKALTNWARRSRFAGSKDRAGVRDLVFDALRQRQSLAWVGGETGRGLMIARALRDGVDPSTVFTSDGYAPKTLEQAELDAVRKLSDAPDHVKADCPEWVWPMVQADWGARASDLMSQLQDRAPVFLRANLGKTTRSKAISALAQEDIKGDEHSLSPSAIIVLENPRRVATSSSYTSGLVELQDAASQAVADQVVTEVQTGKILDYCAGGGGKALALAAHGIEVLAHDIDPKRMNDIPNRAERAGVHIETTSQPNGVFDCVFCDVPCSGSGAWRRQPDAKWRLSQDRLTELTQIQDQIFAEVDPFVAPGGVLAYATCSIFKVENDQRVDGFLDANPHYSEIHRRQFTPFDGADGLFVALLRKN